MSETQAIQGYDSTLLVEDAAGSGNFVELGECKTIGLPDDTVDELDATHMKSPDATKESIPGMRDPGDLPVKMNWVPGSATDLFIVAWKAARERRATRIITPNNVQFDFKSYPKGYGKSLDVGAVAEADLTLKVAGAVTQGPAS